MATEILDHPVQAPTVWKGSDLAKRTDWIWHFDRRHLDELEVLQREAAAHPARPADANAYPALRVLLDRANRELTAGLGFVVLRGFPLENRSAAEAGNLYLAMGRLLGKPISQNSYGDLLGHVRDEGRRYRTTSNLKGARGYLGNEALLFHADLGDAVGLLCLAKAKQGGLSSITSSMTVYNEILAQHPEYLPAYYRGFPYLNLEADGDQSEWRNPIYTYHHGMLSLAIRRNTIETARMNGVYFSELEQAALQYLDKTAARADLRLDMALEPGDVQLLNNYVVMHSRTEFVDDPARPRHMLRLWLQLPNGRSFLSVYPTIYDGIPKTLERA